MMDLLLATSGGEAQAASGGYVDDVFSAYTYTGNNNTQNISGLNFADNAGLAWLKNRTSAGDHYLFDTVRGALNELNSNSTEASASLAGSLTAFLNNGFSVGNSAAVNQSGQNYVGWQFRRAPKFFDIVTYTGNGVAGRQIAHGLGAQAGFVTVKATSTTGDWNSYHRSATGDLKLNLADAQTASRAIVAAADANSFTVSGAANTNGVSYVVYLWAHNPSTEGIIQCGSFTADGSGNATVNLGWEPQYFMFKRIDGSDDWMVYDTARGWDMTDADRFLCPNLANTEGARAFGHPTATGFSITANLGASRNFIYLAIRRPNKPPTSGTEVFAPFVQNDMSVATTGFSVDLVIDKDQRGGNSYVASRLIGGAYLAAQSTGAESAYSPVAAGFQNNTGVTPQLAGNPTMSILAFRRAPGFFDVVCDTGTGVAHAIAHNLTKSPELIIRKSRSAATQWEVWHSALAATEKLVLNSDAVKATDAAAWNSTLPTATQFTVGTGANVNANAATFVTYLFATLAGISKVGSYTGNGSSQTIGCGFSTGARFVLIKRTDATGDWYVWDSVRGIIAANDPHLSLNTTAAEVTTDDSVDPEASGFIVNQNTATNINVNGGQYIFLAIA